MRLEFTPEGLKESLGKSRDHLKVRGNEYHDEWFPITDNEKEFEPISIRDLRNDRRAGIYLIKQEGLKRAYVGLASDFSSRFFNGKDDCKTNCPRGCSCYGHINSTPRTCRSHWIIESGDNFEVYCLQEMRYESERVCQAEIDWYYILVELGFEMVNADWALGVAGFNGRPIVSVSLLTGEYFFFLTITEGATLLLPDHSGGGGAIGPMISGFQNQLNGYTHRYATEEELDTYQGRREISDLISSFDSDSRMIAGPRGGRLEWSMGPLDIETLNSLRETHRGVYDTEEDPRTELNGISWLKSRNSSKSVSGRWQVRAKRSSNSKDIHQTNRKEWVENQLLTAAIYRERKIIAEGWQEWNTGRYASNADWINRQLGENLFTDWERI